MQGKLALVEAILDPQNTFVIPPYQRPYQWNEERWQSLASDISRLNPSSDVEPAPPHWLGVLLLSHEDQISFPGDKSKNEYSVIDGQQRLVTLVLWISALIHHHEQHNGDVDFSDIKFANLQVQKSDQKALEIALTNQWRNPKHKNQLNSQIMRAYIYFRYILWLGEEAVLDEYPVKQLNFNFSDNKIDFESKWEKFIESPSAKSLSKSKSVNCKKLFESTVKGISVFTLIHNPQTDEPVATIFDTLNGMRTELEPIDHVRNSIFVRLSNEKSNEVFTKHWQQAEDDLRNVKIRGLKPGISFIYDFVISQGEHRRQGVISRLNGASHFSRMTRGMSEDQLETFVIENLIPAMKCWPIVIRKSNYTKYNDIEIQINDENLAILDSIRDLTKNPANPLVLLYLVAFLKGEISENELTKYLTLIETYVARQVLSLSPLSPLRAKIMDIASEIDRRISLDVLISALKKASWPSDNLIRMQSKNANFGDLDSNQIGAIFRGIEKSVSGKHSMNFRIGPKAYTIEHIYPKKSHKWHGDLRLWKTTPKKMDSVIQRLGNLTVVSKEHNSRVGNSRLKEKQKFPTIPGRAAPLGIHTGWLKSSKWTEVEIQARSLELINYALKHWMIPE